MCEWLRKGNQRAFQSLSSSWLLVAVNSINKEREHRRNWFKRQDKELYYSPPPDTLPSMIKLAWSRLFFQVNFIAEKFFLNVTFLEIFQRV